MDILKRIDQAQQFCKFYADGAYFVETAKWNHHVNPEFIEDIRQYIESLQLNLMHLQTQQAHKAVCKGESYDMIDRFLRNNLYDDDYESYSEALHEIATTPTAPLPVQLVQLERQPLTLDAIAGLIDNCKANVQDEFLVELIRATEAAHNIGAKP
jgi:hypothetical protein